MNREWASVLLSAVFWAIALGFFAQYGDVILGI